MSQKPTRSKYTTLVQICQLIPTFLVSKLARQYGVDQGARKFSAWSHVVSLLYAQLSHALSLNDVCDALNNHSGKLRTLRGARAPKRNTLSNANRKRNPEMAKQVFWQTLQHLCEQSPGFGGRTYQGMPRRFKRMINVVDSSTIQLVANCMDWARPRRKKAAVKMHLGLNLQSFLPRFAIVDTAARHDSRCARGLCGDLGKSEIVVFDKAYVDFAHLFELNERGVFWVTRAKENMQYRCVKRLIKKPQENILRDDLIVWTTPDSRENYPQRLRLVRAIVEVDGQEKEMTFITNNVQWGASSVVDLYGCRWSIEVFFKELKQTLQLCDFLGHNKKAILWQVWTALLLYVLLRFLAFTHRWSHGFKRLFCLLRSSLWDAFLLRDLLKSYGTASGAIPLNPHVEQLWLPGFEPI